jgi:S-adenosylmethionine:tRNA ribosyltransferase-isomerase
MYVPDQSRPQRTVSVPVPECTVLRSDTVREVTRPSLSGFDFHLPPALEAGEPPEARGLARDQVRLMVSYREDDRVVHGRFNDLPCYLDPGDLLVINTSGTMNAALKALDQTGREYELHLSTRLPGGVWAVELRLMDVQGTRPYYDAAGGMVLQLPAGGMATLLAPYVAHGQDPNQARKRLWLATVQTPGPLQAYLLQYGAPIRYGYVRDSWPNAYYQTVYATETGSAEMPSAGRPFTAELLTRLVGRGIWIAPLLLHTGVASQERDELPYEEFYRVPSETAYLVNAARARGKRVIAVGTTVVRALETVTDEGGTAHPGEGWTRLVITPYQRLGAVNGLLTGLHEPRSTHLAMLQALASSQHLHMAYEEASRECYLWHEFGDLHLIL